MMSNQHQALNQKLKKKFRKMSSRKSQPTTWQLLYPLVKFLTNVQRMNALLAVRIAMIVHVQPTSNLNLISALDGL